MRTRIVADGATPVEVYNLTCAFQRTLGFTLPQQLTTEPTVTVCGSAMGWTSPALKIEHVAALLVEYRKLCEDDERFARGHGWAREEVSQTSALAPR